MYMRYPRQFERIQRFVFVEALKLCLFDPFCQVMHVLFEGCYKLPSSFLFRMSVLKTIGLIKAFAIKLQIESRMWKLFVDSSIFDDTIFLSFK